MIKGEGRKFYRFIELGGEEKLLFLEALVLQLWVGLLLKVIPFRKIPGLFENKVQGTRYKVQGTRHKVQGTRYKVQGTRSEELETVNPEPCTLNHVPLILIQIKSAVQLAGKVSPWKNKCLVSSLAARRMLNKRKIVSEISLGVSKDSDGKLVAHAWIRSGDIEVVKKNGIFTELYRF